MIQSLITFWALTTYTCVDWANLSKVSCTSLVCRSARLPPSLMPLIWGRLPPPRTWHRRVILPKVRLDKLVLKNDLLLKFPAWRRKLERVMKCNPLNRLYASLLIIVDWIFQGDSNEIVADVPKEEKAVVKKGKPGRKAGKKNSKESAVSISECVTFDANAIGLCVKAQASWPYCAICISVWTLPLLNSRHRAFGSVFLGHCLAVAGI